MSLLCKVLYCIINGEGKFCCLCFNTENNIAINDELGIEIAQDNQFVTISDIIKSILGNEINEYVSTFDSICEDCAKSITTIYTFLQKTRYNAMCITQALDWLNNNIDKNHGTSKTLFMEINLQDHLVKHIYDTEKMSSKSGALERFQLLNSLKVKEENQIKIENSKINKSQTGIKTLDIIFDPNNAHHFKCKVCYKVYQTKWNLKNHYLRVHAPQTYKCPKCPRSFGSPGLLDIHKNDNHCKVICIECGKSFTNRQTLIKHELRHNNKTHVCSDCGRTYKSSLSYKNHMKSLCKQDSRANPNNAQFTCDYCNKKYTQKMSLRVHIQYEHGNYKGHICEWCGKKFWAQSRLKAHIVKHTGEKNFTCSICKGKFVTKESLLYHTRLHTGEKPYRCDECGCEFISASRKMYHMKTYHQAATEECDICHSKFSSHAYLKKHKKCHNIDNLENISQRKESKKKLEIKVQKKKVKTPIESALVDSEVPGLLGDDNFSSNEYHEQVGTIDGFFEVNAFIK